MKKDKEKITAILRQSKALECIGDGPAAVMGPDGKILLLSKAGGYIKVSTSGSFLKRTIWIPTGEIKG